MGLLILAACGAANEYAEYAGELESVEETRYVEEIEDEEDEAEEAGDLEANEPIVLPWDESTMTLEEAAYYLARLQAIWNADDGQMWGVPLHAPVTFICNETHIFVSNRPINRPDLHGQFERQYVGDFGVYVGITSISPPARYIYIGAWGNQQGVLLLWIPAEERVEHVIYLPGDATTKLLLLTHLSFHTKQAVIMPGFLGVPGNTWQQMPASPPGRISFELEFNALLYALNTEGDAKLTAINDALSIRSERHARFASAEA